MEDNVFIIILCLLFMSQSVFSDDDCMYEQQVSGQVTSIVRFACYDFSSIGLEYCYLLTPSKNKIKLSEVSSVSGSEIIVKGHEEGVYYVFYPKSNVPVGDPVKCPYVFGISFVVKSGVTDLNLGQISSQIIEVKNLGVSDL